VILGIDVRAAYLRTATTARDVLADARVAAAWHSESRLPRFTVRGLAGHMARGVTAMEAYLDAPSPEVAREVGDATGYYVAVSLSADVDDPMNTAIRPPRRSRRAAGADATRARHRRRPPRVLIPAPDRRAPGS